MKLISDTGPIIGLAKTRKLYLLPQFAQEILIPPMVHRELLGKIGPESKEIDESLNSFIKVTHLPQIRTEIQGFLIGLGEGERQAITLAYNLADDVLLLMDDRAGREVASKLRIAVTGLVGLLLRAKERGLVPNIGSITEELRDNGYWLSDDIIKVAKKLAGE